MGTATKNYTICNTSPMHTLRLITNWSSLLILRTYHQAGGLDILNYESAEPEGTKMQGLL